jgi:hypothetical protein
MNVLQALNGLSRPVDSLLSAHEWKERAIQAEAQLLRVASKTSTLQTENGRLRRNWQRQKPTDEQIVHRAQADVLLMFGLFLTGFETTRQRCLDELGISKRRWNWARSLAQLAGVHDGVDFYGHLSMQEVITRLREGVAAAEEHPVLLRGYMPRNGGSVRTVGR